MESRERFKGAEWYNSASGLDISIVGLGGTGSWLSIPLSRVGENELYLFDKDEFDKKNLAGQLVSRQQTSVSKTTIAKKNIEDYSDGNTINEYGFFDKESIVTPIIFVGVDSIPVRKLIFDKWYEEYGKSDKFEAVLIDGRLTAESYQVFTIIPGTKELEEYRDNQLNEKGLQELPCTLKQTSHVAQQLAGEMVSIFTNWLTKGVFRAIPYYIRKDIPMYNYERRLYAI